MIRNFIFDMGNVLLTYRPIEMARALCADAAHAEAVCRAVFDAPEWAMLDAGTIEEDVFLQTVLDRSDASLEGDIRNTFAHWHEHMLPILGAEEFVKTRKREGRRVFVLSNASMRFFSYWREKPALREIDDCIISAKEKITKPDERIFRLLLDRHSLKSSECLFLDDIQENADAASRLGIMGICFDGDYTKLTRTLSERGIL